MTNVPLPDALAKEIQEEAKAEGLSVSELLTELLRERYALLRKRNGHKFLKGEELTQKLNAVYEKESSSLDPALMQLQLRSID